MKRKVAAKASSFDGCRPSLRQTAGCNRFLCLLTWSAQDGQAPNLLFLHEAFAQEH
jgi:hypothetical protein